MQYPVWYLGASPRFSKQFRATKLRVGVMIGKKGVRIKGIYADHPRFVNSTNACWHSRLFVPPTALPCVPSFLAGLLFVRLREPAKKHTHQPRYCSAAHPTILRCRNRTIHLFSKQPTVSFLFALSSSCLPCACSFIRITEIAQREDDEPGFKIVTIYGPDRECVEKCQEDVLRIINEFKQTYGFSGQKENPIARAGTWNNAEQPSPLGRTEKEARRSEKEGAPRKSSKKKGRDDDGSAKKKGRDDDASSRTHKASASKGPKASKPAGVKRTCRVLVPCCKRQMRGWRGMNASVPLSWFSCWLRHWAGAACCRCGHRQCMLPICV